MAPRTTKPARTRCLLPSRHSRAAAAHVRTMPARISDELRQRIRDLLLGGKFSIEVMDALAHEGIKVSRATVDKEAYALQMAGLLSLGRKPTKPHRPHKPHAKGAGRPRLADGESGKRWSPNRDKVMTLIRENPNRSARDIGLEIGITRQAVERILKDIKNRLSDETASSS